MSVYLKADQISIPAALKAAVAEVHSDTAPADWCLAALDEKNELAVIGTGTGGAAALASHLTPETAFYGLVRTTEAIDSGIAGQKDAVKFAFVTFLGDKLGAMRKGKITTFKGTISECFSPFHVELMNATSPEEVTEAAITELLNSMFGQATARDPNADGSMRIGQRTVKINEASAGRTGLQSAAVTSRQEVAFPPELAPAIADVRADGTPTNWALCRLDGAALVMVGSGSGGVEELASQLTPEHAYYGLARTTESFDGGKRAVEGVKFTFVTFLGENLSVLKKGKITTLKGTITEVGPTDRRAAHAPRPTPTEARARLCAHRPPRAPPSAAGIRAM